MMPAIPKPADLRRRRNAEPSYALLPAEGCRIRRPAWPFGVPTPAEKHLWADLWARPIASMWHAQHIPPAVVGRYTRSAVREATDEKAKLGATLGQLENALGLTPSALARLHLKVEPDPEPARKAPADDGLEAARREWEAGQ